ncbi:MAG: mechanosensitive ion channel family protein [Actinomycetota bacterium]
MFLVLGQQEVARFSTEWWLTAGVSLVLILIFALVVNLIARRYVRRLDDRVSELVDGADREKLRQARRRATVAQLLLNTFQIVVWTVVILIVLTSLGVNLGPLLATAGIAGVALGFGAQTVVRDTLAGFFILAENQYDVGDTVELQTTANPVSGTVETLTLRITTIRAFDGTLNIVPNGNIQVTSNRTRGWGRAIVDLRLSYDQDVDKVRDVLSELFDELREVPPFAGALRDGPDVLGVVQLTDAAQILRVVAETVPSKRWEIERTLREQVTNRLTQRGVVAPPIPVIAPNPTGA